MPLYLIFLNILLPQVQWVRYRSILVQIAALRCAIIWLIHFYPVIITTNQPNELSTLKSVWGSSTEILPLFRQCRSSDKWAAGDAAGKLATDW